MKALPISALLFLVSCSTTVEKMGKGGPQGDTYLWVHNQIGGQTTWKNSMGSAMAMDLQKSFADAVQALGLAYTSWTWLQRELGMFSFKKLQAGEITKRQFNEQMFKIDEMTIKAKEGVIHKSIDGGAELGPVAPPQL
jgi:hypothetical protein